MDRDDRLKDMLYDEDDSHAGSVRTALSDASVAPEPNQRPRRESRNRSDYSAEPRRSGLPAFLLIAVAIAGLGLAAWYWYPTLSKMLAPSSEVAIDQLADEQLAGDRISSDEPQAETTAPTVPTISNEALVAPVAVDAIAPLYDGEVMDEFKVDINSTVTGVVDPANIVIEGLVSTGDDTTPVSILSTTKKSLNVVGEGTWSVSDDGSIVFTSIDTFQSFPTSIYYALTDSGSAGSSTAKVLQNPLIEKYAKELSRLTSASDEEFWKYYEENLIAPYPPLEPEVILVINRMFWRETRDEMGLIERKKLLAKAKTKDKTITNMFLPWGAGGFTAPDLWNMVSTLEVVDLTSSASPKPRLTGALEDRFIRLNVLDRLLRSYLKQKT